MVYASAAAKAEVSESDQGTRVVWFSLTEQWPRDSPIESESSLHDHGSHAETVSIRRTTASSSRQKWDAPSTFTTSSFPGD